MTMNPVRTLVVDDSAAMRAIIIEHLQRDKRIEVVGQAVDAASAREAIKQLDPSVITLDIEMPSMSGLEFLEKIMRLRPMPVLMVSSLTRKGAKLSIKAIELGAVDVVPKPTSAEPDTFDDLAIKVVAAANARIRARTGTNGTEPKPNRATVQRSAAESDTKVIAIGASTGGVEALIEVLQGFPAMCPPTVITQHMPPLFTSSLATRLNDICAAEVVEATSRCPFATGKDLSRPRRRSSSRSFKQLRFEMPAAPRRSRQWPSSVGRCDVQVGCRGIRCWCGRSDFDRDGRRRSQRSAQAARIRCSHNRPR